MLDGALDTLCVIAKSIPGLFPRGLGIGIGEGRVKESAVARLINVLQRRARGIALADLVLGLHAGTGVAGTRHDVRNVCDALEYRVVCGGGNEGGLGRDVEGDVGEHLVVVQGEDFAALCARHGLDRVVLRAAADGDGFYACNVFELFVQGGARGAAEGVGVHDHVGRGKGCGPGAVYEMEAVGGDGHVVCVL